MTITDKIVLSEILTPFPFSLLTRNFEWLSICFFRFSVPKIQSCRDSAR